MFIINIFFIIQFSTLYVCSFLYVCILFVIKHTHKYSSQGSNKVNLNTYVRTHLSIRIHRLREREIRWGRKNNIKFDYSHLHDKLLLFLILHRLVLLWQYVYTKSLREISKKYKKEAYNNNNNNNDIQKMFCLMGCLARHQG